MRAADRLLDTYQDERLPVARAVLEDGTARLRIVMSAAREGDGSAMRRGLTDDFTTGPTIAYSGSRSRTTPSIPAERRTRATNASLPFV